MMEKIKIKIHTKRLPRRNDSMFYYGKHVATLTKGDRKLFVETTGEMQARFTEGGDSYRNDMLLKELLSSKITDKGLKKLASDDRIQMNNWFRVVEDGIDHVEEEIAYTYDEAIELAKSMLE